MRTKGHKDASCLVQIPDGHSTEAQQRGPNIVHSPANTGIVCSTQHPAVPIPAAPHLAAATPLIPAQVLFQQCRVLEEGRQALISHSPSVLSMSCFFFFPFPPSLFPKGVV